jgi:hypothetical protein
MRKERHLTQATRRGLRHQPGRDFAHRAWSDQPNRKHPRCPAHAAESPPRSRRDRGPQRVEISCADDEVETLAAELIRNSAAQRTRDGETALAELGIGVC